MSMIEPFLSDETMRGIAAHAPEGGPGITHTALRDGLGVEIDWLVHRTEEGEVTGVVIKRSDSDQVVAFVLPEHRRKGIATQGWAKAVELLGVEFEAQDTTEDAQAFHEGYRARG